MVSTFTPTESKPLSFYQQSQLADDRKSKSYGIPREDVTLSFWDSGERRYFYVRSSSDRLGGYRVDREPTDEHPFGTCDCPDFENRVGKHGLRCKHLYAVERFYGPYVPQPKPQPVPTAQTPQVSDAIRQDAQSKLDSEKYTVQGKDTNKRVLLTVMLPVKASSLIDVLEVADDMLTGNETLMVVGGVDVLNEDDERAVLFLIAVKQ